MEKISLDIIYETVIDAVEEEEEEEDYEFEDDAPCDEDDERLVAEEYWGLNSWVSLTREASDWYLLLSVWLDEKDTEGLFLRATNRLAKMFAKYAVMVIGGELRYTCSHVSNVDEVVPQELYSSLSRHFRGVSRSEAWAAWSAFRESHGTNALYWAENAFEAFGQGNCYGGPKWAYIARTVRMYETGEITPIMFVDMCWGLEHNGGQFFGKLWDTFRLKHVLDCNLKEDYTGLVRFASQSVAKLYTEAQ
jgi:hypothetical protein